MSVKVFKKGRVWICKGAGGIGSGKTREEAMVAFANRSAA